MREPVILNRVAQVRILSKIRGLAGFGRDRALQPVDGIAPLAQQRVDPFQRLVLFPRQRLDLLPDHAEAAPGLAGAARFNGGVDR